MAAGTSRKISASSARNHTRKQKPKSLPRFSGILKKVLLVCLVGLLAWGYQATRPPPPKICGSEDGPPVTASRMQLKDGRHLADKEYGISKDVAEYRIIFIHGFDSCRHDVSAVTAHLSPDIVESRRVYIVSFDRPGYGESDPNPTQTVKSIVLDIQDLADHLELGPKFYVTGFSLGGQIVWGCLKYIPHRLAGAAMIAPVVNYWWPGIPSNLSEAAYKQHLPQDQWAFRVAHYVPWLNYWWNSQKLFPSFSLIGHSLKALSRQDIELIPRIRAAQQADMRAQVRQQGEHESLHRDLAFAFGSWEFDPTDLKNAVGGRIDVWQGDEDRLVHAILQRYIAEQLPWIHYHEVRGSGHMLPYADGVADSIMLSLIAGGEGLS